MANLDIAASRLSKPARQRELGIIDMDHLNVAILTFCCAFDDPVERIEAVAAQLAGDLAIVLQTF